MSGLVRPYPSPYRALRADGGCTFSNLTTGSALRGEWAPWSVTGMHHRSLTGAGQFLEGAELARWSGGWSGDWYVTDLGLISDCLAAVTGIVVAQPQRSNDDMPENR